MPYCCCCRYPLQFWPFCAFAFWPLAVGVGPPTPFRPVTQVFIHKKRKATRAAERRCQPETAFGIQSAASRLAKVQAKDVPSNQSTNARDILFNRVLRNRCVNCTLPSSYDFHRFPSSIPLRWPVNICQLGCWLHAFIAC